MTDRIRGLRLLLVALAVALSPLGASADPQSAPKVVILLHGLGSGPWGMKVLEWRLERAGDTVHNLGYDTRSPSIELAAESIHEQLQACCAEAERVDFVTHSLGGLVLRSLLENHPLPNAGRAVMLAPPNAGSHIVNRFAGNPLFRSVLGPLAPQLGTAPGQLPDSLPPPSIPFGVIAGSRWLNPLGAVVLPGPHDGTIAVAATRLPGMADHLVAPHTHSFIVNSRAVARAVRGFLSTGRFPDPGKG